MNQATTKTRPYRVPTHFAEAEFSLNDFSMEEILEYIANQDEAAQDPRGGLHINSQDLATIETLLLCGQRDQVTSLLAKELTRALGREIRL